MKKIKDSPKRQLHLEEIYRHKFHWLALVYHVFAFLQTAAPESQSSFPRLYHFSKNFLLFAEDGIEPESLSQRIIYSLGIFVYVWNKHVNKLPFFFHEYLLPGVY